MPLEFSLPNWYILSQPLAFVIFFIAAVAETNRAPFDLPEAETELVSGFHTEYSAFRFSFYFLGEYINMIVISLFASHALPGRHRRAAGSTGSGAWEFSGSCSRWSSSSSSTSGSAATLPRFRYDQLMGIAWKVLLPLVLVNILITAFIRLVANDELTMPTWGWIVLAAIFAGLIALSLRPVGNAARDAAPAPR